MSNLLATPARRWWLRLVLEAEAAPDLLDQWEREFLLGLREQSAIQSDQFEILQDLIVRARSAS